MIRVRIYRCHDSVVRARFRNCALYYIKQLMPRKKTLDIKITFVDGLNKNEKMTGSCMVEDSPRNHKHCSFTIQIDAGMPFKDKLSILAHELTHAKQYATGEMSYDYRNADITIWKGEKIKNYSLIPYEEQPWEIDASENELKLLTDLLLTDHWK